MYSGWGIWSFSLLLVLRREVSARRIDVVTAWRSADWWLTPVRSDYIVIWWWPRARVFTWLHFFLCRSTEFNWVAPKCQIQTQFNTQMVRYLQEDSGGNTIRSLTIYLSTPMSRGWTKWLDQCNNLFLKAISKPCCLYVCLFISPNIYTVDWWYQ
jgi:hypothetical protein